MSLKFSITDKMRFKYSLGVITMFALGLFLLSSCSSQKKNNNEASLDVPSYEVTHPDMERVNKKIRLPGEIKPYEQVDIYAKVTGFVKDVPVDLGSQVHKGSVIAVLDAPELEAQLAEALSRLHSAEATMAQKKVVSRTSTASYNRLLQTSKTPGTVSQNDLDLAESKMRADSSEARSAMQNVESGKAYYQSMAQMKSYLTITAPFDGIITERNVHPGALVGPNAKTADKPLFRLEEEAKLRLAVAIPEAYAGGLMNGRKVKFTVKAYPQDTFTAKVNRTAGSLSPNIRSEMIEMDIPNESKKLKPGMYAEVQLEFERPVESLTIPKSALVQSTERTYVLKIDHGKAFRVNVSKGADLGDKVEIFGNVKPEEALIKNASDEIEDGSSVKTL